MAGNSARVKKLAARVDELQARIERLESVSEVSSMRVEKEEPPRKSAGKK